MTNHRQSSSDEWTEGSSSPVQPVIPVQPVDPRLTSSAPSPRRRKPANKSAPAPQIQPNLKPTKSTIPAEPVPLTKTKTAKAKARSARRWSVLSGGRLVVGVLPYLLAAVSYLLPVLVAGVGTWWVVYYLAPTLAQGLADKALAVPLGVLKLGGGLMGGVSPLVAGVWCSIVDCDDGGEQLRGGVARVVHRRADQALDIFQSMIELSSSDQVGMSLHPVEAWELATAVRYTSAIEDRLFISDLLGQLGDGIRDVRDEVIDLNAQGINSFTWIEHEFSRIERLLSSPTKVPAKKLEKMVDQLFEKINTDLNELLRALDKAIPLATRTSDLGRRVFGTIEQEKAVMVKEKEEQGVVEWLGSVGGWKGKQLRRDLRLCRRSADGVKTLWTGLENTRTAFKQYQSNVGQFKAGVIGFHAAGHGLSPEDEIASLSKVMGDFRQTLEEVKSKGRRKRPDPNVRELPGGEEADEDGRESRVATT